LAKFLEHAAIKELAGSYRWMAPEVGADYFGLYFSVTVVVTRLHLSCSYFSFSCTCPLGWHC